MTPLPEVPSIDYLQQYMTEKFRELLQHAKIDPKKAFVAEKDMKMVGISLPHVKQYAFLSDSVRFDSRRGEFFAPWEKGTTTFFYLDERLQKVIGMRQSRGKHPEEMNRDGAMWVDVRIFPDPQDKDGGIPIEFPVSLHRQYSPKSKDVALYANYTLDGTFVSGELELETPLIRSGMFIGTQPEGSLKIPIQYVGERLQLCAPKFHHPKYTRDQQETLPKEERYLWVDTPMNDEHVQLLGLQLYEPQKSDAGYGEFQLDAEGKKYAITMPVRQTAEQIIDDIWNVLVTGETLSKKR